MLQAATFALQASAFASMSSSTSGGSDPSSVLCNSEHQQFSLPSFSNSYSFPNSPPMTGNSAGGGDGEALLGNTNNPDICVTNVIGDEVLLLGGGKSTPSSSTAALSTETINPSSNLLSSVASPLNKTNTHDKVDLSTACNVDNKTIKDTTNCEYVIDEPMEISDEDR